MKKFDKYAVYVKAVQSPEADAEFLRDLFREIRLRDARSLREDFCGTFAICCEWVKLHKNNRAYGVDLDPVPIEYGQRNHLPALTQDQVSRVRIFNENVLSSRSPQADIVASFNFSHFVFKDRHYLLEYFKSCKKNLNRDGIFIIDAFGGKLCHSPMTEKTRHKGFVYEWEQESFNEINHHTIFHINFHMKGERRKRRHVFSYDWRLWTLPELQDAMREVGFRNVSVYWETTDASGEGSGNFVRETVSDECDAWVAYVVGY